MVLNTPAEVTVARLRRHGRVLSLPALAFVGILVSWGALGPRLSELWLVITFWAVSCVLLVGFWIVPLLWWLGNRIIVTTRRVTIIKGLLVRHRQEILFNRMHDLTLRQNAFQAMFGSGDILINTGAQVPVRLHDVPQAHLVLAAMTELLDQQAPLARHLS